ncbi:MAG: hypothetical protein KJO91_10900 [Gammaproteobacteria bacterium]|nr:hypothetical protein [Gammaproteobacteria bacterium]
MDDERVKDAGYWQAIDNLAYYIRHLSEQTQVPVLQAHPEIWDKSQQYQTEFCRKFMSSEELAKWDNLDVAFGTVMETYGTEYDETFADVQLKMWKDEFTSGELIA